MGPQDLEPAAHGATHPYWPAEEVPTADVDRYYASAAGSNSVHRASYKIEHGLSPDGIPNDFYEAARLATRACSQNRPRPAENSPHEFASNAQADLWYGGAIILATIPAAQDRKLYGAIRPETAGRVYRKIARDILPRTVKEGFVAEAIVCALGARAASLGDPDQYLHLSSLRESANTTHDERGRVYNHDLHQLVGGSKIPVEVKLRSGTTKRPSDYDDKIVFFQCMNELSPAILGVSQEQIARTQMRQLIPVFVRTVHRLMLREIRTGGQNATLDAASRALMGKIASDHAVKGDDPRFYSPRLAAKQR